MFSSSKKEKYITPVSRIVSVNIEEVFLTSGSVSGSAATTAYEEDEDWN